MEIVETQDGSHTLKADGLDVTYHSRYGAIQESMHVFIQSGLYYQVAGREKVSILEMGFGTGLNALLTYIESLKGGLKIQFTGVDNSPVPVDIVRQLNYTQQLAVQGSEKVFAEIHQAEWNTKHTISDSFTFQKLLRPFEEVVFEERFNLIYYDAFAPKISPEHWEPPILQKMYDSLEWNGVLVTYCAKGSFKRSLKEVGFRVETLKGPPGKREMTRASK